MNKSAHIRRFFETLWFDKAVEVIDEFCSPLIILDSPIKKTIGCKAKKDIASAWFNAFSDQKAQLDTISENSNNIVMLKWHCSSTNVNSFCGLTATHQKLDYNGICYFRVNDQNLITEYYAISNVLSELANHGATPYSFSQPTTPQNGQNELSLLHSISNIGNVSLTKREIQTLGLWLKGLTAKESSRVLNISARTIEEYRNNIKTKFSVYHKSQLFKVLRDKGIMDFFLNFPELPTKY